MYIDYSSWETFEYKISSLELDKKNPRFDHIEQEMNQPQIIKYLIQNEQVYELAKKISEEGYFVGEEPIICIENNKKIVLEGNRRTAALKVLQEPKKYLSTAKANILLNNILKNSFPVDKKVRCYIAPNRLMANPIIYERHNGVTLNRWKTGNQYAFVAKMYYEDGLSIEDICDVLNEKRGAILKPLKAYNLFFEGKDILEKEEGVSLDVSTFNFTNLERFYNYDEARKLIGLDFDNKDGQLSISMPREEFEKRLSYIFKLLIDADRFSREFDTDSHKSEYIKKLKNSPEFKNDVTAPPTAIKGKKANERADTENAKNKITVRKRRKSKANSYFTAIIPRDKEIIFDNEKLDGLFAELKSLTPDKKYSFAVLVRSYLEQMLYIYLRDKKLLDDASDKTRAKKLKDNEAKVNTLIKYLEGKIPIAKGEFVVEDIMNILKFKFVPNDTFVDFSLRNSLDYVKNNVLTDHLDPMTLRNTQHYIDRVKDGLDLAVHNPETLVDIEHNKRAWAHLEPLFDILSNDINIEK
jgi:hypothetical protein